MPSTRCTICNGTMKLLDSTSSTPRCHPCRRVAMGLLTLTPSVVKSSARCDTAARGYGRQHQALRAMWRPIVESGEAQCHQAVCIMPTRSIAADAPWDLGHNRERTAYIGPTHPACNRAEGALRGRDPSTLRSRHRCCEVCGTGYRASYRDQRTCGRTCGVELKKRNALRLADF